MRPRLLIAACIALFSCGDGESPTEPPKPISRLGTYALQTVDGQPLPYTYPNATHLQLTSETLTLHPDASFDARTEQRRTSDGATGVVTNSGTYQVKDTRLTLTFSSGHVTLHTFTADNELTGTCCGSIWVYRRSD